MARLKWETGASQAEARRAYAAALEELSPEEREEGHLNSAQVRRSAARRLLEGRALAAAHEMPPLANPAPPENVAPPNSSERRLPAPVNAPAADAILPPVPADRPLRFTLDARAEQMLQEGIRLFGEEYGSSLVRLGIRRALEKADEEAERASKRQRQ
jgi:hypothetical protein